MYMSFLCVFITPNNLYSLPLEQVGRDYCFLFLCCFCKQFLLTLGQHLLMDIMQHPRTGLGHPEALIGGNDITYSRHITAHDRIIYDIYDNLVMVLIVQAEEHDNNK